MKALEQVQTKRHALLTLLMTGEVKGQGGMSQDSSAGASLTKQHTLLTLLMTRLSAFVSDPKACKG